MAAAPELVDFRPDKDTLLTIGVFDGVHLGHKHLVSTLVRLAREQGLLAGVVTFRRHPQELLSPRQVLPQLTDLDERIRLLKAEGVDFVVALSFTPELASCAAREFLGYLQRYLRMWGLVIGPDFALGRGREGDTGNLQKLGQEMGFSVTIVPPMETGGEVISSTAIRQALASGNVAKVSRLLGRPFSLHGQVVRGAGRGTAIGFPTANLEIGPPHALPADGVYAGWAHVQGETYRAMINIGTCPTFDACPRTVEVYIIDYCGNLYGKEMRADFLKRIREERKFDSVEALKKQMARDVDEGRAVLGGIDQA